VVRGLGAAAGAGVGARVCGAGVAGADAARPAITTPVPDTVSVRLRGRVSDLRSLSSQNLEVTLDVSWVTPGDAVITLSPQAMSVPPQIDVVAMEPTKLRFHVEPLRQKVVPIRPFLVGQPPPGYNAGDPTLIPDHALISGPASQIRNVTEVATERIIMTGRTETFLQNVTVVSDSSLIRIIEPLTTQATVPVNPEIGPVAPVAGTAETATETETAPEKKPKSKGTNEDAFRHRRYPRQGASVSAGPQDDVQTRIALCRRFKAQSDRPRILLGMDTRESGPEIAGALVAGIAEEGGEPQFIGVIPTPASPTCVALRMPSLVSQYQRRTTLSRTTASRSSATME